MANCCESCQQETARLREVLAEDEAALDKMQRSWGPDSRIGTANCDVSPFLLMKIKAEAYGHLERAREVMRKYYNVLIEDIRRD